MNKLIFIILFTFVSSISFSKEITLNCKFLNGEGEQDNIVYKNLTSSFKQDIIFKFDESKETVFLNSIFFSNSNISSPQHFVSFSQDLIVGKRNLEIFIETFSLNRLTGILYRQEDFEKTQSHFTLNYKCSQIDKKLF
jgi:hypothetical protein